MKPEDLSDIHARAMTLPGPWSTRTLRHHVSAKGAILVCGEGGFALGRAVADEAELLTLAVDPACQRRGVGAYCLQQFEAQAAKAGAARAFLEVAAPNAPARSLYKAHGWSEDGVRKGYYTSPDGRIDAILMSKPL